MNITIVALLTCISLFNAAASICTKYASAFMPLVQLTPLRLSVGGVAWIVGALLCFTLSMLCYANVLKTTPVSLAYPIIMAGSALFVTLYAFFVLGEALAWQQYAGIAFFVLGTMLVSYRPG